MNKNCYKSEILNELSDIRINEHESKNNLLKCECNDHGRNAELREGNKLFVILVKKDNKWSIHKTICWNCSVRNIVERLSNKNNPIAIVEGTLQLVNINKNKFYISEPDVWEIIVPKK